jgi:hypothetical protein
VAVQGDSRTRVSQKEWEPRGGSVGHWKKSKSEKITSICGCFTFLPHESMMKGDTKVAIDLTS